QLPDRRLFGVPGGAAGQPLLATPSPTDARMPDVPFDDLQQGQPLPAVYLRDHSAGFVDAALERVIRADARPAAGRRSPARFQPGDVTALLAFTDNISPCQIGRWRLITRRPAARVPGCMLLEQARLRGKHVSHSHFDESRPSFLTLPCIARGPNVY